LEEDPKLAEEIEAAIREKAGLNPEPPKSSEEEVGDAT